MQNFIEKLIFGARWLLAPLYVGLIVVLIVLAYKFVVDLIVLVQYLIVPTRV